MRQIAERLVLDLVAVAIASAKQMGDVLAALILPPRSDDVNCPTSLCHGRISALICRQRQYILVTTLCTVATAHFSPPQAHNLYVMTSNWRGNFSLDTPRAGAGICVERENDRTKYI